jgi:hypothetical protein
MILLVFCDLCALPTLLSEATNQSPSYLFGFFFIETLTHLKHHEIASSWTRRTCKSAKTLWHYISGSSAVTKARYNGSGQHR